VGFSLGLERAGHECVGHCEIDPYACRVLKKHWPGLPLFGDITKFAECLDSNAVELKDDGTLPPADLWAAGFP